MLAWLVHQWDFSSAVQPDTRTMKARTLIWEGELPEHWLGGLVRAVLTEVSMRVCFYTSLSPGANPYKKDRGRKQGWDSVTGPNPDPGEKCIKSRSAASSLGPPPDWMSWERGWSPEVGANGAQAELRAWTSQPCTQYGLLDFSPETNGREVMNKYSHTWTIRH